MPRKRRTSKLRVDPRAAAQAWATMFRTGHDYFADAQAFTGLTAPHNAWPPEARPEAERAWQEAAAAAWATCGAIYLAAMHDPRDGAPWALQAFGEPGRR